MATATSALAHTRASHRDAWLAKAQQGSAANHRGVGREPLHPVGKKLRAVLVLGRGQLA